MSNRKKRNGIKRKRLKSFWSLLLAFGSLAGLFSLPHTIFEMRKEMPSIQFESTGIAGGTHEENGTLVVEKHFNGKLKNRSHAPNAVTQINLVVFNKQRNAFLRDGYTAEAIADISETGSGKQIALPINLNPKEAKKLIIVSHIQYSGTDQILLDESYPKLTDHGFVSAKYEYELIFEDVNGNHFDMTGNHINQELMNLKWIYQDESWYSPKPLFLKTKSRLAFHFKKWMAFLGLSYD
ncbi:hypothetical protein HYZ99_03445 [Candidatus Peregrinibacteria bacterium]|nr:hypothetical protein [Candidatus Peregrinibacteria bacterium]